MAIYHCSIKNGSRGKGQSAVAAAAYRAGDKLLSKETGILSDYTNKTGIVFSEIALCDAAPSEYMNRETLWNEVHKIEKAKNARLWREIEVALPKEFNPNEQIETVREYVKTFTEQGMCADWSIHDKKNGNPHAHIMLTTRSINNDGSWAPKSRKVYDLDENGEKIFQKLDKNGCRQYKCHKEDYNDWNKSEKIEEWRKAWADCCNARLNIHERIDHRSYERQGVDQIPTIHEGYAARQMAAEGRFSERIQFNEDIRKRNSLLKKITAELNNLKEKINTLLSEQLKEGRAVSDGKQRISELFKRRNRTIDNTVRGSADGERTASGEDPFIAATAQRIAELKRIEEQQRLAAEAERKRKAAEEIARRERAAQEAYENQRRGGMSR